MTDGGVTWVSSRVAAGTGCAVAAEAWIGGEDLDAEALLDRRLELAF